MSTQMHFSQSSHLSWLYSEASQNDLIREVNALLQFVGMQDGSLIEELCKPKINKQVLSELAYCNARIASYTVKNHMRDAAVDFWVAQALVTTVLRGSSLDRDAHYSDAVTTLMERGADGLYHIGEGQFFALRRLIETVTDWFLNKGDPSVAVVESPLGNTIPVQTFCDYAGRRGLKADPILWTSSRNDRASRGYTIKHHAQDCAEKTSHYDYVLFIDDVITGSRLKKIFDAFVKAIGEERFLPIALVIPDSLRPPGPDDEASRVRLQKRIQKQALRIGFDEAWVTIPHLRLFRVDGGGLMRWESPLIWGDSDLIAGKRKVNLIFTLIDHVFLILKDLGSPNSVYRPYLERAWTHDVSGQTFEWKKGLLERTSKDIGERLSPRAFKRNIVTLARVRFPDDYEGRFASSNLQDFAADRWNWMREVFLTEATKLIGSQEASLCWMALDNAFSSSFGNEKPRADRDQDAAPYFIDYNNTIQSLNKRLRSRVLSWGGREA